MKRVEVFTDGACSGNPGPGGWGAILRYNDTTKNALIVEEYMGDSIKLLEPDTPIEIVTRDGQGKDIDTRTVTIGDWSSSEWTLKLPADGALGNYLVTAKRKSDAKPAEGRDSFADYGRNPEVTGSFLVAAYRRPECATRARPRRSCCRNSSPCANERAFT